MSKHQSWLEKVKHLNKAGMDALREATEQEIGTQEQRDKAAQILKELNDLIEEIKSTI